MTAFFRCANAVLAVALSVLSQSCNSSTISSVEIAGVYELSAPGQSGSLKLSEDGNYEQILYSKNGIERKRVGRWAFNAPSNGELNSGTVRLYGALRYQKDLIIETEPDYSVALSVHVYPRRVDLFLSADGNESYFKRRK